MATWSERWERLLQRLPRRPRTAVHLTVATIQDAIRDRITGLAAEIAFWVLLSLPPLLLVAASAAGFVGSRIGEDVRTGLIGRIQEFSLQIFSSDTVDATIAPTLDALLSSGSTSVLSVSFAFTMYSASRVLRVLVLALTIAYDLDSDRPTWVARLLGIGLTFLGLLLATVLTPLVVAGPELGAVIEDRLGMNVALAEIYRVLYWPAAFLLVAAVIAGLYHLATPFTTPWRREIPGAVLATVLGLVISLGLRTYTGAAFGSDALYAALAAPLAILVWVWLSAIALLLGAELNAEIERMFPSGAPRRRPPDIAAMRERAASEVRQLRNRRTRADEKDADMDDTKKDGGAPAGVTDVP